MPPNKKHSLSFCESFETFIIKHKFCTSLRHLPHPKFDIQAILLLPLEILEIKVIVVRHGDVILMPLACKMSRRKVIFFQRKKNIDVNRVIRKVTLSSPHLMSASLVCMFCWTHAYKYKTKKLQIKNLSWLKIFTRTSKLTCNYNKNNMPM
jgi:hypothetical protein